MNGRCLAARIAAAGVLLGVLEMAPFLYGQAEQGAITGTVTDASGALVPGADIGLTEVATQTTRTANTNESGSYFFPYSQPSVYQLSIAKQGLSTEIVNGIDYRRTHGHPQCLTENRKSVAAGDGFGKRRRTGTTEFHTLSEVE